MDKPRTLALLSLLLRLFFLASSFAVICAAGLSLTQNLECSPLSRCCSAANCEAAWRQC
jgi:hypothetical protein